VYNTDMKTNALPCPVRSFFTDEEWDAISSALADYADYGEKEAALSDSIDAKIITLFQEAK